MKYKLFLLLAFFVVPLSALAAEYHSGDNVLLASDQQIDSNYYAAGQNIEVYGTVNGDLFLAGDNITVDSENINGDIFAAGNTITIKGTVNGSVRTAGQQVNIMAQVRDNVMFFGPLAWTIIFGLTFATFLTLIMIPVMYYITYTVKTKVKRNRSNRIARRQLKLY